MPDAALAALICPHCAGTFPARAVDGALRCSDGHAFDAARQGYINLLTGHGTRFSQDTAAMVAARADFLAAGHYSPLADAVVSAAVDAVKNASAEPVILDAGTGTGYYLRQVLAAHPAQAIALDISKFALRRAARTNPGALNLAWNLWDPLPVAAKSVDVILNIFSPRNPPEFARVLKPGGRLLVVTPDRGHLAEIAEAAGLLGIEEDKQRHLAEALQDGFEAGPDRRISLPLSLSRTDVANAALMGPAGHHLDPAALREKLAAAPDPWPVTARFRLQEFTRRR